MRAAVVAGFVLCASSAFARPDTPGSDLFTFDVGDVVEQFDTDHFRIHYTRAGTHAVPVGDVDEDTVPDSVQEVGTLYEDVLSFYESEGFLPPMSDADVVDNGGDDRFDVYLVDFGLAADGAFRVDGCDGDVCVGCMVQENDFAGYGYPSRAIGNRVVASHEFFHAIQSAYDDGQGENLQEGTAVWATEQYDATLNDFELLAGSYIEEASTPLDADGGSFAYGTAFFFQSLSERHGPALIRELWEDTVNGARSVDDPHWFDVLDDALARHDSTFADEMDATAIATLFTGARARDGVGLSAAAGIIERDMLVQALPLSLPSYTVFAASSRATRIPLDGATENLAVTARFDDDHERGRVHVFAVPFVGDVGADPVRIDPATPDADVKVAVAGADSVVLLVVNVDKNDSARPDVCAGDDLTPCTGSRAAPHDVHPPPGCACGATAPRAENLAWLLATWLLRRRRANASHRRE